MKVYQRLAHAFAAEGVTTIFGMMGHTTMHWADELHKVGVRKLEVRHEGFGLGMADGWARATHTTAVAHATGGPGVTQLATALVTASRAASPVVVFTGDSGTTDYENAQYFNPGRFAAACESGFVRVDSPDVADEAVRMSFYRAKLESRPIMLSAPLDIQLLPFEDDDPYVPSTRYFGAQRAVAPDAEMLERAADIIAGSSKPVIIVGRGAMWSGAGEAVLKLGNRIGALIGTSLRAKNWLSDADYHVGVAGQYGTRMSMELFADADCVIAAGASMNRYTTSNGYLFPDARVVHLDPKPHVMMGGRRGADCYVQSDARLGLEALESLLARRSVKITGYRTPDVKTQLAHNFADRAEFLVEPGTVDPRAACTLLDEMVPPHVNLCTSSGAVGGFSNLHLNRARPIVMASHFFGCIGQMLPAAMGAIVASGNQPMLLVDGDASTMMHLADFDTAVRYKLPLLVVVLNDEALGAERHHMHAAQINADLADVPSPDIGAVATALGGRGCLARSIEELRAAAAQWVANPGPMIIDVRISRNVLPMHIRRMDYARDE